MNMPLSAPPEPRFIQTPSLPQDYLSVAETPEARVQDALEHAIGDAPLRESYTHEECSGFFRGPTALAYLLLRIHAVYPEMKISGRSLQQWAASYMGAKRTGGDRAPCGLACESAAYCAVETMLDETKAPRFREVLERLVDGGEHPHEILFGFAGILYMIRAVESCRPESVSLLATVKGRIIEKMLGAGPGWTWRGKRYTGAVHGDIGILTQLLLTDPTLASNSMVCGSLQRMLSLQQPSGNWPTEDSDRVYCELVQFCHGAPGFVSSLVHIERLFPDMREQIGQAIALGRECIWREGLLRKLPCLCHGVPVQCPRRALPLGPQRDHFLAWSLPSKVEQERQQDESAFVPEDGGRMSIWFDYWPSVAWTWAVCAVDNPGFLLYSDV